MVEGKSPTCSRVLTQDVFISALAPQFFIQVVACAYWMPRIEPHVREATSPRRGTSVIEVPIPAYWLDT